MLLSVPVTLDTFPSSRKASGGEGIGLGEDDTGKPNTSFFVGSRVCSRVLFYPDPVYTRARESLFHLIDQKGLSSSQD